MFANLSASWYHCNHGEIAFDIASLLNVPLRG
jgi:hypothetical protein